MALSVIAKLHPEYTKLQRLNVLLEQTFPFLMEQNSDVCIQAFAD